MGLWAIRLTEINSLILFWGPLFGQILLLPVWSAESEVTEYEAPYETKTACIVATIRVEPSVLVFLAIISKSVKNQCYNPYIFGKISKRSFRKCMVCSIDC